MEKGEMSAPKADPGELPSEVLSRILSLAAAERAASNAGMWKMNVEAAVEIHGQACEALYEALYAEIDKRDDIEPVKRQRKIDPVKIAKAEILKVLRSRIGLIIDAGRR
jgi:hypothetical protein